MERRKLLLSDHIFLFLATTIIALFPFQFVIADEPPEPPQVEVEIGPAFEPTDKNQVGGCFESFKQRFPLDIFVEPLVLEDGDSSCPTIEIFGYEHEFCQPLLVWQVIKPVVFMLTLYQAVLHL